MAGNFTKAIHKYGRAKCIEALKAEFPGVEVTKNYVAVLINQKRFLVNFNIKPHDEKNGEQVTGKNSDDIKRIEAKKEIHQCSDVLMVFYDIKIRHIYYEVLSELMKPFEFAKIVYPHKVLTHGGEITYWSLFQLRTLTDIPEADVQSMIDLRWRNKNDINQKTIFD